MKPQDVAANARQCRLAHIQAHYWGLTGTAIRHLGRGALPQDDTVSGRSEAYQVGLPVLHHAGMGRQSMRAAFTGLHSHCQRHSPISTKQRISHARPYRRPPPPEESVHACVLADAEWRLALLTLYSTSCASLRSARCAAGRGPNSSPGHDTCVLPPRKGPQDAIIQKCR